MPINFSQLQPLGWKPFFTQQLSLQELESAYPARVIATAREHYHVHDGNDEFTVTLSGRFRYQHNEPQDYPTVGDWVLLDPSGQVINSVMPRLSLLQRGLQRGHETTQALAANVDQLWIVTAMNREFNPRRLERYLILAEEAGITALIILTKADLCADSETYLAATQQLKGVTEVFMLDTRDHDATVPLQTWLQPGTTVVLAGSSGVGKSTLLNTLAGDTAHATNATRRDDKGRHTTTGRLLRRLPNESCVIDIPGIREVGLPPGTDTITSHYEDIEALAAQCRYHDCRHNDEPGCAVQQALADGLLDPKRWETYCRLIEEAEQQDIRGMAIHERRARDRAFGRMVHQYQKLKRKKREE